MTRFVSSAIDDKLYEALVEAVKIEERTISNFIRISIKERIIKINEHIKSAYENE